MTTTSFEIFFKILNAEDKARLLHAHETALLERIEAIETSLLEANDQLISVRALLEEANKCDYYATRPKSIRDVRKEKVSLYLSKNLRDLLDENNNFGKSYAHLIRTCLNSFYETSPHELTNFLEDYFEEEKNFSAKERQTFVTNISTDLLAKIDQSADEFDTDRRHIIESILWANLKNNSNE